MLEPDTTERTETRPGLNSELELNRGGLAGLFTGLSGAVENGRLVVDGNVVDFPDQRMAIDVEADEDRVELTVDWGR